MLTEQDFGEDHRNWHSCDPFTLFDAPVETQVPSVCAGSLVCADATQNLRTLERNLKQEARNADLLMIWTDCDREGEHIGYEVVTVCRSANARLRVRRARFSALIEG